MDNASKLNIQALIELGIQTAKDCSDELDKIVDLIHLDKDIVEFEQTKTLSSACFFNIYFSIIF